MTPFNAYFARARREGGIKEPDPSPWLDKWQRGESHMGECTSCSRKARVVLFPRKDYGIPNLRVTTCYLCLQCEGTLRESAARTPGTPP